MRMASPVGWSSDRPAGTRLSGAVHLLRAFQGSSRPNDPLSENPGRRSSRDNQSLLGLVAGLSFGLLWPGACAGFPDGNWPGGKFAFDGAIRSSSFSIWNRFSRSFFSSTAPSPFLNHDAIATSDA